MTHSIGRHIFDAAGTDYENTLWIFTDIHVSVLTPQRLRGHFIKTTSPHPRHTRVCLGWVVLLAVRTAFHRLAAVAEVREHGGFAWVGCAERSRRHIVWATLGHSGGSAWALCWPLATQRGWRHVCQGRQ
eukprot:COSAG03_NODE_887_length_5485_cov_57.389157_7_plen_130_part_00